jgi:1-pyrroline-5-carboxylate dehydrogenase
MLAVPRSGLHNPFKNPERYNMLGKVSAAAAREVHKPEVMAFFTALIQRVVGKSAPQCEGEVRECISAVANGVCFLSCACCF